MSKLMTIIIGSKRICLNYPKIRVEVVACLLLDIIAVALFYLLFFLNACSFGLSLFVSVFVALAVGAIIIEMWGDESLRKALAKERKWKEDDN